MLFSTLLTVRDFEKESVFGTDSTFGDKLGLVGKGLALPYRRIHFLRPFPQFVIPRLCTRLEDFLVLSRHRPDTGAIGLMPLIEILPLTICFPSGLKATELTEAVWPLKGWPTGWPLATSHSRRV